MSLKCIAVHDTGYPLDFWGCEECKRIFATKTNEGIDPQFCPYCGKKS